MSSASLESITSITNTLRRVIGDHALLSDIQHSDLLTYRKALLTGDIINPTITNQVRSGRMPSTVNKQMSVLLEMLKLANRSQFIVHAPYEGVSRLKLSKREPDPQPVDEFQALTLSMSGVAASILIFSVYTGMRPGEICALAWEDVDLDKGEVHVLRNLTCKNKFVPPKTDAGIRTITRIKPALDVLKKMHKMTASLAQREICFQHREHGKTEQQKLRFVFVPSIGSSAGHGHSTNTSISYPWRRGTELSGIRERNPISPDIRMHAGHSLPVLTHRL